MSEFLALAALHLLALIIPGPDFAVTLRQSLHFGRRAGMLTALGIGSGISLHVLYSLAGVAALLQTSDWLLMLAELLGAGWLLYLGVLFVRRPADTTRLDIGGNGAQQSHRKAFLLGFMTNASNPKATLFFLAVFTTLISSQTPLAVRLFYGLWMCSITALWFVLVSLLFTRAGVRGRFLRISRWLEYATGLLLMAFAMRLFWQVADKLLP